MNCGSPKMIKYTGETTRTVTIGDGEESCDKGTKVM